jgi:hypothetical protein
MNGSGAGSRRWTHFRRGGRSGCSKRTNQARAAPLTLAFNMFRRRPRELVCAVPQDCVVPGFVTVERWAFEGVMDDTAPAPPGFDRSAATLGVKYNGFYLFQILD